MSNDVLVALPVAAVCALGGLFVPRLIARLPEPVEEDVAPQPPRPAYSDLAREPGLAARCAALAAVTGALIALALGADWSLLVLVPIVPPAVLLGYVDLRTRLLPTRVVRPAHLAAIGLAGVAALIEQDAGPLVRALVAMVVVRSFFWVLWFVRSTGMGFGDVRLSALLAFLLGYLGWGELVVGTYAAFLVFGVPGLALAIVRRDRSLLRTAFPFGPALLVGALIGILWGATIWSHLVAGGA